MAETHWRRVDGLVLPAAVAGHPALELVNTFSGWDGDHASDYLASYAHVAVLAGDLGLVPPHRVAALTSAAARDPHRADAALERAREVRRTVRAALVDPADPPALAALADTARAGARTVTLVAGDPPVWRVEGHGPDDLDHPADAFAWAAADLATRPDARRVRACPGRGCGWTFLDTSGRRRWCSMAWCGNRSKVRAHAARTRADAPGTA